MTEPELCLLPTTSNKLWLKFKNMSVQDEILRIKSGVALAYEVALFKGAKQPQVLNVENLADTVASIGLISGNTRSSSRSSGNIQNGIDRIKSAISLAYDAALGLGATRPDVLNVNNLAETISTIPIGLFPVNDSVGDNVLDSQSDVIIGQIF